MKYILNTIFLLLINYVGVFSQTVSSTNIEIHDSVQMVLKYNFSQKFDMADSGRVHKESYLLFVCKNSTLFKPYNKYIQDSIDKVDIENNSFSFNIDASKRRVSHLPTIVGIDDKYFEIYSLITNYSLEDTSHIVWQISEETQEYNGLVVHKATTNFKGRTIVVWYCPDIPINAGPYKFNGLPGLIVEAGDSKGDFIFQFKGYYSLDKQVLNFSIKKEEVSRKKYFEITNRIADDPMEYVRAMSAANGITMTVNSINIPQTNSNKKRVTILNPTNPIELE
ncbi:MAG: GLPGLI family protein [Chitinophagaceae bacterium]